MLKAKNTTSNAAYNVEVIKKVAKALNELNEQVVYVGGAVISLYAKYPTAEDVRPTKDVDISLSVASIGGRENSYNEIILHGSLNYKSAYDSELMTK